MSFILAQLFGVNYKCRKQVTFVVCIFFLNEIFQFIWHITCIHIRWISTYNFILLRKNPVDFQHHIKLRTAHSKRHIEFRYFLVQTIRCSHRHQRTIGVRIRKLLRKFLDLSFQHGRIHTHHIRKICKIRLIFRIKNAPVILPCLHHHRKIRELIRTAVDVQTVQIMPQDRLCCIALRPPATYINLHQHIKCIHENMPRAHAWINHLYVFRLQVFIII